MKRLSTVLLLIGLATLMAGCFQSTVRVVLKADGSGTIAVSQHFDYETIDYLRGDLTREAAITEMFSVARMELAGAQYGENIALLAGKPASKANGSGYLAIYRFTDINQIQLPLGQGADPIRFSFQQGELTALLPGTPANDSHATSAIPSAKDRNEALKQLIAQLQQNGNPYKLRGSESLTDIGARVLSTLQASVELDLPPGTDINGARFPHPQKPHRITLVSVNGESMATSPKTLSRILSPSASTATLLTAPGVQLEPRKKLTFKLP